MAVTYDNGIYRQLFVFERFGGEFRLLWIKRIVANRNSLPVRVHKRRCSFQPLPPNVSPDNSDRAKKVRSPVHSAQGLSICGIKPRLRCSCYFAQ